MPLQSGNYQGNFRTNWVLFYRLITRPAFSVTRAYWWEITVKFLGAILYHQA